MWWIEFWNGERSRAYASEAEAWATLVDLQTPQAQTSRPNNCPVFLVSSHGLRFPLSVPSLRKTLCSLDDKGHRLIGSEATPH